MQAFDAWEWLKDQQEGQFLERKSWYDQWAKSVAGAKSWAGALSNRLSTLSKRLGKYVSK